jgi:hypothetical protein
MSGFERSSRQSATRRFSPPESGPIGASHGGRRSASAAISSCCSTSSPPCAKRPLRIAPARRERVEIGVGFAVRGVDLVEPLAGGDEFAQPLFDRLAHRLDRVELRLLFEVPDRHVGHRNRLAVDIGVDAGHDAQQRRLAGAVEAEDADLRARQEAERNVLEDLTLRRHVLPTRYIVYTYWWSSCKA